MGGVMTLVGLFLFMGSSWALGTIALARTRWPDLRGYERAALKLLAGLGLTALLLSLLTLAGRFADITLVLAALTTAGIFSLLARRVRFQANFASPAKAGHYVPMAGAALLIAACLGCLGAIAPVTDDDALAYVVP